MATRDDELENRLDRMREDGYSFDEVARGRRVQGTDCCGNCRCWNAETGRCRTWEETRPGSAWCDYHYAVNRL